MHDEPSYHQYTTGPRLMKSLRRDFRKVLSKKQDWLFSVTGKLGDGQGNVTVADREYHSYVRIGGAVSEIYNKRVEPINDLPVICGHDPNEPDLFQVLAVHHGVAKLISGLSLIAAHAATHRLFDPSGGTDPVWIEGYQVLPLRIGKGSGVSVKVYPSVVWTGTAYVTVPETTVDLSGHIPSTAGKAAFVLITISTAGAVVATKGSEVDVAALTNTDIPAPPAATAYAIGCVRVYTGQTAVRYERTNTDIVDLRWFARHYHTAGEISGATTDHDHSGDAGDGGAFDAANLSSGAAADGYVLTADGSGGAAWEVVNADANLYQYVLIRDEKPQNTNGGTATAGSPETRVLNTEVFDAGNNVALANNQMTVEAGNYRVFIKATALGVRIHRARLQNITDGTTLLEGQNAYGVIVSGYPSQCDSVIVGRIALAAQKVLEVQSQVSNTVNNTGYGQATNFSGNEIYTVVELWKEP